MLYDDLVPQGQWLCHHGVKGQKWGIRRYQNADGTLTKAGKKKYLSDNNVSLNDKALKRHKFFRNQNFNVRMYGSKIADNIIGQYNLHNHKIPDEKLTKFSNIRSKNLKLQRDYRSKEKRIWDEVYKEFYGADYNSEHDYIPNFNRDKIWKETDRRFKEQYPKLYNNWNNHKNDYNNAIREYADNLVRSTISSDLYNAREVNDNKGYRTIGDIITQQMAPILSAQVVVYNTTH
jgi:hypothetical protein